MTHLVYVDNSNVFIEGMRVSAVRKKLATSISDACSNNVVDYGYRFCFGKLHELIARAAPGEMHARLFGSRPPENDTIWKIAHRNGFDVSLYDRNVSNKEKKLDTGITAAMVRDAFKLAQASDAFTIVSGDADYVPAVETVRAEGFQVNVAFWSHASRELKNAANNFISLDPHLEALQLK